MKKMQFVFITTLCAFLIGLPATAQSTGESFIRRLRTELRASGWEDDAIQDVLDAANNHTWEGSDRASVQAVALGLSYIREQNTLESAEQAVQIAFVIAQTSSAMASVGITRRDIGRAAVMGTRNILKDKNIAAPGGSAFQDLIVQEMRNAALRQSRVSAGSHARDHVHRLLSNMPVPSIPAILVVEEDEIVDTPEMPGHR